MADTKYASEDPQAAQDGKHSQPDSPHGHHLPMLGGVQYPSDTALVSGEALNVAGRSAAIISTPTSHTLTFLRCQENRSYRGSAR